MVPSISFSGRECRHADNIFAFPARTEFSVTTGGVYRRQNAPAPSLELILTLAGARSRGEGNASMRVIGCYRYSTISKSPGFQLPSKTSSFFQAARIDTDG